MGESIRSARKRRDLTSLDFSERIGISHPTYMKIEAGDTSVSMAAWMAAIELLGMEKQIAESISPGNDKAGISMEVGGLKERVMKKRRSGMNF